MGVLIDAIDELAGGRIVERDILLERGKLEAAASTGRITSSEYDKDPWRFVTECVWTLDQADTANPVKRFPIAACRACRCYLTFDDQGRCRACSAEGEPLSYLETITRQWASKEPPILFLPKSRRMKISWLMCALHTWLAATRRGAGVFLVSSKEEKSAELVSRCEHILRYVPKARFPMPVWKTYRKPPMIDFPTLQSQITGIAEGPDQLRQYTATAILGDEIGTWKWPRATYAAMKPTIEGGGRITLVSSPYPGFWKSAVSGELGA